MVCHAETVMLIAVFLLSRAGRWIPVLYLRKKAQFKNCVTNDRRNEFQ